MKKEFIKEMAESQINSGANNSVNDMENKMIFSGQNGEEVVAQTAGVNDNTDAKSESKKQIITDSTAKLEDCGCSENTEKLPISKKAIINGQEQEIIIGFTNCNVLVAKKKEAVLKLADKRNALPVKFNFAKSDLFWNEKIVLKDINGDEILEGTPNVYVLCPEPGTNCRIFFDEVLTDVEVHDFQSVQEWAVKVGTTNQLSQGFDKTKEVAVSAFATGNEVAMQVARFAMQYNTPESVAEAYLSTRLTPKNVSLMMMGHNPKVEITLGRTWEDAVHLFDGIRNTFGDAESGKRYAVRAINTLLDGDDYDLETILMALKTIPAEKVTYAKLKKCGEKELCIVMVLTSWITQMRRDEVKEAA